MNYNGIWKNKEKEEFLKISKGEFSDEYRFQYYNKEKDCFDETFDFVDIYDNKDNTAILQNKTKRSESRVIVLSSNSLSIDNIQFERFSQ